MLTIARVEVLRVSPKVSKGGKDYNLVTLFDWDSKEKFSTFLPEELVPDMYEGATVQLELEVGFRNWKPEIRIKRVIKNDKA